MCQLNSPFLFFFSFPFFFLSKMEALGKGKVIGLGSQKSWILILAELLISCIILGKLLHLRRPQFPFL